MVGRLEKENKQLIAAQNKIKEENDAIMTSNIKLKDQKRFLDVENNTMKTTIWAFTIIVVILVAAGTYVFTSNASIQATPLATSTVPAQQIQKREAAPQVTKTVDFPAHNEHAAVPAASCDSPIDWRLAKNHVGRLVAVHGTVKEYRYMPNVKGAPTWINLGAKYPAKNRLTMVIWGDHRNKFGRALSESLVNRQVCIIGKVGMRDGIPQITLKWPRELIFQ